AAFGPEPQIHTKTKAVFRHVAENARAMGRHPRIELVYRDLVARNRGVIGLVEKDDVDVAAEIELVTAELTHPEHDEGNDAAGLITRKPVFELRAQERRSKGGFRAGRGERRH